MIHTVMIQSRSFHLCSHCVCVPRMIPCVCGLASPLFTLCVANTIQPNTPSAAQSSEGGGDAPLPSYLEITSDSSASNLPNGLPNTGTGTSTTACRPRLTDMVGVEDVKQFSDWAEYHATLTMSDHQAEMREHLLAAKAEAGIGGVLSMVWVQGEAPMHLVMCTLLHATLTLYHTPCHTRCATQATSCEEPVRRTSFENYNRANDRR